ncbi:hypothetical protein C8F04DRAFT_1266781 [Mycena alexandri]|uniref:Uncharacterized protein n=1 Tax=Mycena alexandri TaxID=1745969 RepID=A0AAD6SLC2_9AGAR|nr:hypothetical protein C8F04DRAFT_1266781 [Mycena alexandri]
MDLDALLIDIVGDGYQLWSASTEGTTTASPAEINDSTPRFDNLHAEFEERHGPGPYSGTSAVELAAIGTVGAEESAHEGWRGVKRLQPGVVFGYSPAYLRTTAIDVELHNAEFERHLREIRQAISDLEGLITRRESASKYILELQTRPVGSQSIAPRVLGIAIARNKLNLNNMSSNLVELLHRLERMQRAKEFIEEELTRRLLAREDHARSTTRPSNRGRRVPVIDLSPSPPTPAGLDIGSTTMSSTSSLTPSPPPSYRSRSPTDSDGYYSMDDETGLYLAASRALAEANGGEVLHDHVGELVQDSYSIGPGTEGSCLDASLPYGELDSTPGAVLDSFSTDVWLPNIASADKWWVSHGDDPETLEPHVLSQRVEVLSNVKRTRPHPAARPGMVGLLDQPTRSNKTIACLSALIKIGDSEAYTLFDSGSNTDSMVPEYANVIKGPRIILDEQVTLQLGCVGSRSKISFGTRVPVDFGGLRGHVYFDQVNLDRYDVIIGTPLMNRHGIVLDFGKREIRFPGGHTIKALSSLEEASIVSQRKPGLPAKGKERAD